MKTEWDYSELAEAYVHRPDYAPDAIAFVLQFGDISEDGRVCDVGAGVGHLTLALAPAGVHIDAVEPNDAMRQLGVKRTQGLDRVRWFEATGEDTKRPSTSYDLVSFGSSFNVVDREKALAETHRLLRPGGSFACMWNHRDLNDPLQSEIERIIESQISDYSRGARREDQTEILRACGWMQDVESKKEFRVTHSIDAATFAAGWRSHATVQRQSGKAFEDLVQKIEEGIQGAASVEGVIQVPYTTRVWVGKKPSQE